MNDSPMIMYYVYLLNIVFNQKQNFVYNFYYAKFLMLVFLTVLFVCWNLSNMTLFFLVAFTVSSHWNSSFDIIVFP